MARNLEGDKVEMKFNDAAQPIGKCTCGSNEFVSWENVTRGFVYDSKKEVWTETIDDGTILDGERISWNCRSCDKEIIEADEEDDQ